MRPVTLIAWGDWIEELAVLREIVPGVARLSGGRIRNHFFLGLVPEIFKLQSVQPRVD